MTAIIAKTATKTPNYTDAMVARMRSLAPLNKDKAADLAREFGNGKTARSIIAKAKREGIEYQNAEPAKKRPQGATKSELVEAIEGKLNAKLEGLAKAPAATLSALLSLL